MPMTSYSSNIVYQDSSHITFYDPYIEEICQGYEQSRNIT